MPEILEFPDASVGDEVGVTIEYMAPWEIGGTKPMVQPVVIQPPSWAEIWASARWRVKTDFEALLEWGRNKWRQIRHRWGRSR